MIKSAYISLDDTLIMSYNIEQGKIFKKKHLWDFKSMGWWSRIFEY